MSGGDSDRPPGTVLRQPEVVEGRPDDECDSPRRARRQRSEARRIWDALEPIIFRDAYRWRNVKPNSPHGRFLQSFYTVPLVTLGIGIAVFLPLWFAAGVVTKLAVDASFGLFFVVTVFDIDLFTLTAKGSAAISLLTGFLLALWSVKGIWRKRKVRSESSRSYDGAASGPLPGENA